MKYLSVFVRVFFFSALGLLILFSFLNRIEYHDDWALKGVEIWVLLFTLSYCLVVVVAKNVKQVVAFSSLYSLILFLIPVFKYSIPLGTGDVIAHYSTVEAIYSKGYIPNGIPYSDFPIMHILVVIVSTMTAIPPLQVFGCLYPVVFSLLVPAFIYILARYVFENENYTKFALVFSPFLYYGRLFSIGFTAAALATLFVLATLTILIADTAKTKRANTSLVIFFLLITVMTHPLIPLTLSAIIGLTIVSVAVIRLLLGSGTRHFSYAKITSQMLRLDFFLIVAILAWFMFLSQGLLITLWNRIYYHVLLGRSSLFGQLSVDVLARGYRKYDLLELVRLVVISRSADLVMLVFTALGICLFLLPSLRRKKIPGLAHTEWLVVISLIILSSFSCILLQNIFRIYDLEESRFISAAFLLSPVFAGLAFGKIRMLVSDSRILRILRARNLITVFLLFSILSLSLTQLFPSEALYRTFNRVNSIYELKLVQFTKDYDSPNSTLSMDALTKGLVQASLGYEQFIATSSARYTPAIVYFLDYANTGNDTYLNLFREYFANSCSTALIHMYGKAGILYETLENVDAANTRIATIVNETALNVIYDSGESYCLSNPRPRK